MSYSLLQSDNKNDFFIILVPILISLYGKMCNFTEKSKYTGKQKSNQSKTNAVCLHRGRDSDSDQTQRVISEIQTKQGYYFRLS